MFLCKATYADFFLNGKFMYKIQSLKADIKANMEIIKFFQYFCEKMILRTHKSMRVSYGSDRAGKTALDAPEEMFKNIHIVS